MKNHPIYGKFFKMLSMGIPKNAVKQKLEYISQEDDIQNEVMGI